MTNPFSTCPVVGFCNSRQLTCVVFVVARPACAVVVADHALAGPHERVSAEIATDVGGDDLTVDAILGEEVLAVAWLCGLRRPTTPLVSIHDGECAVCGGEGQSAV